MIESNLRFEVLSLPDIETCGDIEDVDRDTDRVSIHQSFVGSSGVGRRTP